MILAFTRLVRDHAKPIDAASTRAKPRMTSPVESLAVSFTLVHASEVVSSTSDAVAVTTAVGITA